MKKCVFMILIFIWQTGITQDITQGLVAYYPFSGNANDVSGNGHNPTAVIADLTSDINGNANSAYYFYADTSYIIVPYHSDFQLSQFTLCSWINSQDLIYGLTYTILNRGILTGDFNYRFELDSSKVKIHYRNTNNAIISLSSPALIQTGQWFFVTTTYDGDSVRIYVDAQKMGSVYDSFLPCNTTSNFLIGAAETISTNMRHFSGTLDEIRIYNRALSDAEIDELYIAGLPGIVRDSLALVALYESTNGIAWVNNSNWLSGNLSSWYGITIAGNRVVSVDLHENNLNGTLPGDIGYLDQLGDIYLYNNTDLTGALPPEIGKLTNVWNISINNSGISGSIPPEIGQMSNLYYINLSNNQLTGNIPNEIGNLSNLGELYLNNNQLTGTIPSTFSNLTNLWNLSLNLNQLSGNLPDVLWNLTNLINLDLGDNNFSGSISASINNLTKLHVLAIGSNTLSGSIPAELCDLKTLTGIWLYGNQLSGNLPSTIGNLDSLKHLNLAWNNLDGSLPTSLGSLDSLEYLYLDVNNFSGTLPGEIGSLSMLRELNLWENQLNGEIPTTIGNLTNLRNLELGKNAFSGAIPDVFDNLSNLNNLGLFENQLSGSIPATIGSISSLRSLLLGQNNLTGTIPDFFQNLDNLEVFHAQDNQLSGSIPPSLGVCSSLRELVLARNQLTGDIPTELYNATNLEWLALNENQLTGSIPSEIGQLSNLNSLQLYVNTLSGAIPDEITSLNNLQVLDLGNNQFTSLPAGIETMTSLTLLHISDNNLAGTIPDNIGNLINLTSLWLHNNQLTGSIPSSIGSLVNLEELDLTANQLSGGIPASIGGLTKLRALSFRDNQTLSGPIPVEIGNLVNLEGMDLAFNALSDTLPSQLGNLKKLANLTIDFNQFTGIIPPSLGNCDSLQVIYLGGNNLSGPIPKELGNLSNLNGLHLFDNNLSGTLPPELGDLINLTHLGLGTNNLSGAIPESFTNLTKLSNVTLDNNQFTDLPDLSSLSSLTELLLYNNRFTFEDLEPNVNISGISYMPQDSVGEIQRHTINAGDNITLTVTVGGANNQYQWYKGDEQLANETGTSYTITNANNNDNGSYVCRINNSDVPDLILWSRPMHVTVSGSAPDPPQLLTPADDATGVQTNPALTWQRPSGALTFQCQVSLANNFTSMEYDETGIGETSVSLNNLNENTTYYWRVRAFNSFGASTWSATRHFTTLEGAPPDPDAPVLGSPTNGQKRVATNPTLIWNAAAHAQSYHLQVSRLNNFTSTVKDYSDLTGTSQQIEELDTGTTYYWRVEAVNETASRWSATWSFTTVQEPSVTVMDTTDLSPVSVTLNGTVNPHGLETTAWIEYGTDDSYGMQMYYNNNPITGEDPVQVAFYLEELAIATTYHYKIVAENTAGTGYTDDQQFTTLTYPEALTPVHTYAFPSRPNPRDYQETDFRIIGFPGASDLPVAQLFTGTAGEAYEVVWDKGTSSTVKGEYLVKYSEQPGNPEFKFLTGRAFWVISRNDITLNRSVASARLNTAYEADIKLHNGWNLITNPFNRDISWSWIKQANSVSEPIHAYQSGYQETDTFSPYTGYYFYNASNLSTLKIPYPKAFTRKMPPAPASPDWKITITLTTDDFTDLLTELGVSCAAKAGLDTFDFRKPPRFGAMAQLYFKRPSWDANYHFFARDIRPEFNELEIWDFELYETEKKEVRLAVRGINRVPEEFEVYLVDLVHACYSDLRQDSSYAFKPVTHVSEFKVLIGEETALKEELRKILPSDYILGNNFPNPFNPKTTIPVSVPMESYITIKIYNLLGQEVATLFKGTLTTGRHYLEWDGGSYASGVYLYRLLTKTGKSRAGKMVLLK